MPAKTWKEKYANGCEWCGVRFPGINSVSCGLDSCHVIAREFAPEQAWNVFLLCPNCHRIFDQVIKPKFQHAIHTAMTGFGDTPTDAEKKYVVAKDFRSILKGLIKQESEPATDQILPEEIAKLTVWRDRPHKVPLRKDAQRKASKA